MLEIPDITLRQSKCYSPIKAWELLLLFCREKEYPCLSFLVSWAIYPVSFFHVHGCSMRLGGNCQGCSLQT